MQRSVRYARILVCAVLVASSFSALAVAEISGNSQNDRGQPYAIKITTTITTTEWSNTTLWNTTTRLSTTTQWNITTRLNTTTDWKTATVSPTVLWILPINQAMADVFTAVVVGLVVLVFTLIGSALILRSRSSKTLEELNAQRRMILELKSQLSGISPETAYTASSALKRLLEMGVLQPKEYMEKKMLAERLEKKMSAKQLLDEGLISKEQYEALARREQERDQT